MPNRTGKLGEGGATLLDVWLRGLIRDALKDELPGLVRDALAASMPVSSTTPTIRDGMSEWFSVAEAATVAGVSPKTIRRAVRRGLLSASSPGVSRQYRIRRSDLELFMRSGAKPTALPDVDAQVAKILSGRGEKKKG